MRASVSYCAAGLEGRVACTCRPRGKHSICSTSLRAATRNLCRLCLLGGSPNYWLQSADTVILYDPDFNPFVDAQASGARGD